MNKFLSVFFHVLSERIKELGQYMGLPSRIRGAFEVHNHEFKGRPFSVVMLLCIHTQCPGCKQKVNRTLDLTRFMVLPREN